MKYILQISYNYFFQIVYCLESISTFLNFIVHKKFVAHAQILLQTYSRAADEFSEKSNVAELKKQCLS